MRRLAGTCGSRAHWEKDEDGDFTVGLTNSLTNTYLHGKFPVDKEFLYDYNSHIELNLEVIL